MEKVTNTLGRFLKTNLAQRVNVKYVASKSFTDEAGKPLEWELRASTVQEDEQLRKECTKRRATKYGQYTEEFEANEYMARLVANSIVYPDLNDSELQDSYGARGASSLLKQMLLPGEYTELTAKINEVNGYEPFEQLVEEAKN